MSRVVAAFAALLISVVPTVAGATDEPNALTHGMAQMTLHVGTTSQYEVLEAFGGPNITTLDGDGREVWVYDRHATVTATSDSGFSIGMLVGAGGSGVAGGAGLGFGKSKSKSTSSQRTMILVIKFGPDKRVVDFKSRSSSY